LTQGGLQDAIFSAPVLTHFDVRCAPVLEDHAFRRILSQISAGRALR
jgi:hypothetical protein